jgi:hypothetical protein
MPGYRPARIAACAVMAFTAAILSAQTDIQIPHERGQTVTPSFEGWFENSDGTFSLEYGYMNRNFKEILDIPIGPDNRFEQGPADQGQPTHFLPRRHTGLFTVVVPKDFGTKKLYWTLTSRGQTFSIPGHLKAEWKLDPLKERTSGNTPPVIKFDPAGQTGQGPVGVKADMTVSARTPATLNVWATDDGVRRLRGSRSQGPPVLGVTWSQYRGPGRVTFTEIEPKVEAARAGVGSDRQAGRRHGWRVLLLLDERLRSGERDAGRHTKPLRATSGVAATSV